MPLNNSADAVIKVGYDGKAAETGLAGLVDKAKLLAVAYGAIKLGAFTTNLAKMGDQARIVEKSFSGLVASMGVPLEQARQRMKKATLGMIDDSDLMAKANKAMIAGIKFDDIIVGMEYVSKHALATGKDFNEEFTLMIDSFTRGTGRGLLTLGLDVKNSKDVINDSVKQMKERMDGLNVSTDNAVVSSARMAANWKQLQENFGKIISGPMNPIMDFFTKMVGVMAQFADPKNLASKEVFDSIKETISALNEMTSLTKSGESLLGTSILGVDYSVESHIKTLQAVVTMNDRLGLSNDELTASFKEFYDALVKIDPKLAEKYKLFGLKTGLLAGAAPKPKKTEAEETAAKEAEARKKKQLEDVFGVMERMQEDAQQSEIDRALETADAIQAINDMLAEEDLNSRAMAAEEAEKVTDDKIKAQEKYRDEMIASYDAINNAAMVVYNGIGSLSDALTNREIKNLDKQHLSKRQYDKKLAQIEEKADERNRAFARAQQLITVGRTISAASEAAMNALATGAPFYKWIDFAAVLAAGSLQIATVQAQNFATGKKPGDQRGRLLDDIPAMIGRNEAVIPAAQTAAHRDEIEGIINNTANTVAGRNRGTSVMNFFGLSTEQVTAVIRNNDRKRRTGSLI
jgi:hypothetical protein